MFAICIDLLAGRYVATAYNDRDRVEWPPHPARLFSALIATWAAADQPATDELAALEWLETQPPPQILASPIAHAGLRDVVPVFVPVNDTAVVSAPAREKLDEAHAALAAAHAAGDSKATGKAEKAVGQLASKLLADTAKAVAAPAKFPKDGGASGDRQLPERRSRQPRTFPSATPACPTFGFVWTDATPTPPTLAALERLLGRLVRLGHSSTLLRASIGTDAAVAALRPQVTLYEPDDLAGRLVVRWVSSGQCQRLQAAFAQHQETEPRVLPARFVRYREGEGADELVWPTSVFVDPFIVFARVDGPRLPITSAAGLAKQFRRALMSVAEQPVAEMISGHQPDGSPSLHPHLAIVPLPVVAGPNPDGAIIGVGVVLPRQCSTPARLAVIRAIAALEAGSTPGDEQVRLHLGEAGTLVLRRDEWGDDRRSTLQAATWTRPSRTWGTATPIALDRNPGDLASSDAAKRADAFLAATAIVAAAVGRIGLPPPCSIRRRAFKRVAR
jgi:CRISPR-associated protein Csb2